MAEQRYTETDQLSDVIDAIQLGRKSGTLMVVRGMGGQQEQGAIVFVNGQPIQATAGPRTPMEALQWLSTWNTCLFVFIAGTNALPPPITGPVQHSPMTTPIHPQNPLLPPPRNNEGSQQNRSSMSTNPGMPAQTGGMMPPPQRGPGRAYSPLLATPYRRWPVNEALHAMEQRGFSRNHRRIFLLLDGQRTVKDLAMLMGRNPEEIYLLLDQLEKAGFIQL
jgi:hypothetical protein